MFYGDSDTTSSEPSKNPVQLENLHATPYDLIGINAAKELMAPGDRSKSSTMEKLSKT